MSDNLFRAGQSTTVLFLDPETDERVLDVSRIAKALVKAAGGEVHEGPFEKLNSGWFTRGGKPLTVVYNCADEPATDWGREAYPWREAGNKMRLNERPITLEQMTRDFARRVRAIEAPGDPVHTYYEDTRHRVGFNFSPFAYAILRSLKTYEETLAFHESA